MMCGGCWLMAIIYFNLATQPTLPTSSIQRSNNMQLNKWWVSEIQKMSPKNMKWPIFFGTILEYSDIWTFWALTWIFSSIWDTIQYVAYVMLTEKGSWERRLYVVLGVGQGWHFNSMKSTTPCVLKAQLLWKEKLLHWCFLLSHWSSSQNDNYSLMDPE